MRAGLALALALGLVLPVTTRAQLGMGSDQDKGKPVEIEASQGIEWQQNAQVYIARGNAKVARGGVTLRAETIYAYYRPAVRQAQAPPRQDTAALGGGNTEIFRVIAEGTVSIATATQTVYGDRATYDLDQALILVTGKDLRLVTPTDLVTARDSLEWYDAKQVAVARGDAVALREQKRVRADVLMAQVVHPPNESAHISRVDASGNVLVSTNVERATGRTGVYNADTGIATLSGDVTINKGDNVLRGQHGVVDMNNNVSRLLAGPPGDPGGGRVQGLMIPGAASPAPGLPGAPSSPGGKR